MFYKRPGVLDLLAANNLKFTTDEYGNPLLNSSRKAGLLSVETLEPDAYTPQALYAALDGAERAEKEYMKTGQRPLATDNSPKTSDWDTARLIAAHLTNDSLRMLAERGLHGRYAGNRAAMQSAVQDLLYKGSYGRDLYTNTYTGNMPTQMGHTTANSLGGTELRPELAAINTSLQNSEGADRLEAIRRKRVQLNAMKAIQDNPELLNDPDVKRLIMGDKTFVNDLLSKANNYGFDIDSGRDTQASGVVAGEKPTVINAGEGSRVYVEAGNGNGNGNKAEKIKAILKNENGHNGKH